MLQSRRSPFLFLGRALPRRGVALHAVTLLCLFCFAAPIVLGLWGCEKPDPRRQFFIELSNGLGGESRDLLFTVRQSFKEVRDASHAGPDELDYSVELLFAYSFAGADLLELWKGIGTPAFEILKTGGNPAFMYTYCRRLLSEVFLPHARRLLMATEVLRDLPGGEKLAEAEAARWQRYILFAEKMLVEAERLEQEYGQEAATQEWELKMDPDGLLEGRRGATPYWEARLAHLPPLPAFTPALLDEMERTTRQARAAWGEALPRWAEEDPRPEAQERGRDYQRLWAINALHVDICCDFSRLFLDTVHEARDTGLTVSFWGYFLMQFQYGMEPFIGFAGASIYGRMGKDPLAEAAPELSDMWPVIRQWYAQGKEFEGGKAGVINWLERNIRRAGYIPAS